MNISGFELVQSVESAFCPNGFCSSVVPLCFAGVSPGCARNRSTLGWHHFSFGEHVCRVCFEFLGRKPHCVDSAWRHRLSSWRRERSRKSSTRGRQIGTTEADFLAAQLLPWWLQCRLCGRWRQLPPRRPIGDPDSAYHPNVFTCSSVIKRTTLVLERPCDFLSSMRVHAWLQAVPAFDALCTFGVDLTGLSMDSLPGSTHENLTSESKTAHWFPFGDNSPFPATDLLTWERASFPEMVRFPTLYLAVRNLILCLWYSAPKRLLTSKLVSDHCFVRGLLRIVLCEHWIPRVLEEFTCRGLINFGACEIYHPAAAATAEMEPSTILDEYTQRKGTELSVRLLGPLDLCTAVATRQILNGILTHHSNRCKQDDSSQSTLIPSVDVRLQPMLKPSVSDDQNPLDELWISLPSAISNVPCQPDVTTPPSPSKDSGDDADQPIQVSIAASTFQSSVLEDNDLSAGRRISMPAHFLSDRVHLHRCHPVSTLAQQTNMSLLPVHPSYLFESQSAVDSGKKTLKPVSTDAMVRMEFHVEAVLDMIAQIDDQTPPVPADHKALTASVQDSWDMFDAKVRERVTDLDNSEFEKRLADYYLASVEYDLTEPLTINPAHTTLTNPIARLDQLPTGRYSEFLTDHATGTDTASTNAPPWSAHTLTDPSRLHKSGAASICASLLSSHLTRTQPSVRVLGLSVQSAEATDSAASIVRVDYRQAESTPRVGNGFTQSIDTGEMSTRRPVVCLHSQKEDTVERVDWVVLCASPQTLRFIFADEVPSTLTQPVCESETTHSASAETFFVCLPSSLKRVVLAEEPENNWNAKEPHPDETLVESVDIVSDTTARLITVTLIYSSAWWRPALAEASSEPAIAFGINHAGRLSNSSVVHGDVLHYFSFLPTSRNCRSFCHMFRDVCPSLSSPGVLQTQIFAAAADLWWSKPDADLITAVDQYLHSCLGQKENEAAASTRKHPIHFHVARLDHHSFREARSTVSTVLSADGRHLRLKPGAAVELAKHSHIIIPSLFVKPSVDGSWDPESAPDSSALSNFHGMDTITSAVYSGLHLAEVTLRSLLKFHSPLVSMSTDTDPESSIVDSSHCVGEFTATDGHDSDTQSASDRPTACDPPRSPETTALNGGEDITCPMSPVR
ncbi:unnamed protein product [Dicrocoelium dendriticum]|nr:unnamed protein product [Dicrocoelium dendriticum]